MIEAEPAADAARVLSGDTRAVARLITRLENRDPRAVAVMRALAPSTGRAQIVGITGPPGSGKSTLVDRLIRALRARGHRVGVIAVDPSSPFTGGAILGDRLRMNSHATDEGVFIRSLASRGHLGGLSRATAAAARVLDAAGYDIVIIETVGVGQSEVDIVRIADTVVLLSVPGLGDDIQVIKAGIMEIGDIFVVNKADREGADRVVREIRGMLETAAGIAWARFSAMAGQAGHHGVADPGVGGSGAVAGGAARSFELDGSGHPVLPPVLRTVAETGEGCEALLDAILAHRADLEGRGLLAGRRLEAVRAEIRELLQLRLVDSLDGEESSLRERELASAVVARTCDIYEAADRLFDALFIEATKGGVR